MNLQPFKESVQLFRNLQEGLPGGKLVKKSQIMNPGDPNWDPSKHLGRSIPKAAERLRTLRK